MQSFRMHDNHVREFLLINKGSSEHGHHKTIRDNDSLRIYIHDEYL